MLYMPAYRKERKYIEHLNSIISEVWDGSCLLTTIELHYRCPHLARFVVFAYSNALSMVLFSFSTSTKSAWQDALLGSIVVSDRKCRIRTTNLLSQHDVDLSEGEKVLHRTCPPQARPPLAYRVEWFERVVRTVSVAAAGKVFQALGRYNETNHLRQRGWTSFQNFDEAGPERLGGRGVCSSGRLAKAT